jgi:putative ABC transport system ATP-binding protein
VLENFRLAALRTGSKTLKTGITSSFRESVECKISELELGLENKMLQPMGNLSGGQRQALTLLMATMDKTKLLLMDEPVAALDPRTAALVMKLSEMIIRKYQLTAILVTHNLRDAHIYGDRIIQLAEGKVSKDINGLHKKNLTLEELFSWF